MKKLLNISVIAALVVLPLAANAAPMTEVEIKAPQDNQTVATTGYVKGAYNALVAGKQDKLSADQLQAIEDVTDLNTDVSALKTAVGDEDSGLVKDVADLKTTVGNSTSGLVKDVADNTSDISALETTVGDENNGLVKDVANLKTASGDYATKTGVAATVNAATGSVTGVSLEVTGTPTGRVDSTLSGAKVNIPTTATVPTLTTWGNDSSNSTATVTLNTTETAVNGTVTSTFTGTGISSGTAAGSITGIDVSVSGYQAN